MIWKFLWYLTPVLLLVVIVWGLSTLPLTGLFYDDPVWMYSLGWAVVGACLLIIILVAIYEVYVQVDYNFMQVSYQTMSKKTKR